MPAPAVIPAPRAYINAVAVKGFVVELWVVKRSDLLRPFLPLSEVGRNACDSGTFKKPISRKIFTSLQLQTRRNARRRASVLYLL